MPSSTIWGDIKAILWKNWCLRKSRFIVSLFEICLPAVFFALLLEVKENQNDHKRMPRNETIFPNKTQEQIISESFKDDSLDLIYTPNISFTNELMKNVFQMLHSKTIGTFAAVENETMLEIWFETRYGNESSFTSNKGYGIIFESIPSNHKETKLKYVIRNTKSESWQTDRLFPAFQKNGPMEAGEKYFSEGFIALQIAVDSAFISLLSRETNTNFFMQEFPYPAYEENSDYRLFYNDLVPTFTLYGFIIMGPLLMKLAIEEKQSGAKEYMKMVGLRSPFTWLSWVIFAMMVYTIVSIVLTIIVKIPITTGAIMAHVNPIIVWILLFSFCLSSVFFFLGISSFFENPSIGSSVGLVLWVLSHSLLQIFEYTKLSFLEKFLTALLPITSFIWISLAIGGYESLEKPLGFGNIFQMSSGEYLDMSVGMCLVANVVGILIWIFVMWYLDEVKPGKYGRAKPWYFIFKFFMKARNEKEFINSNRLLSDRNPTIEDMPQNREVGLRISNICKKFGSLMAVNHLSIDIYHSQITALLGHNGAGKTTLMSIITGLFSPTSGDVYLGETSVFNDLYNFRKTIGLCPQHNLLFSYLTASEHLIFFGMLKGLSMLAAKMEGLNLLNKLGIEAKKDELVHKLSGGMKRKLSLAISLVGNPKILILDEPTSGMDPESRREVWDILLGLRENRTIIISTHFMEEADVLGDRIAIMDHGEIKCYGSSLFLKQHYGTGYQLKLTLDQTNDPEIITSLITQLIPEATLCISNNTIISYILPTSQVANFSNLFTKLESDQELGITGIGLSCTTMEDVFLSVSKDCTEESLSNDAKDFNSQSGRNKFDIVHKSDEALTPKRNKGLNLFIRRIQGLLIKKIIWTYNHWFATLFFVIVYPVFITTSVAKMESRIFEGNILAPSLLLNLMSYTDSEVLVSGNSSDSFSKSFEQIVMSEGSHITKSPNTSIVQGLLTEAEKNEFEFRSEMVVAADLESRTVLFSSIAIHAPAIAVNLYSNVFIKSNPDTSKYSIETYNHPFSFITGLCIQNFTAVRIITGAIWSFLIPVAFMFSTGSFINSVHKERLSSAKQLQLMTGLSPVTYWIANFCWDYIQFLVSAVLILLTVLLLDSFHILLHFEEIGVFLLSTLLFGMGAICLAYVTSFFLQTYVNSFSIYIILSLIFGIVLSLVTLLLIPIFPSIENLPYIFMFNPYYCFSSCLYKIIPIAVNKARCRICWNEDIKLQCANFNAQKYLTWDKTGINIELTYLAIDAALYFTILLLFEFRIFTSLYHKLFSYYVGEVHYNPTLGDSNVANEKARVDNIVQQGMEESGLIVDGLGKKFTRNSTAVHGISLCVSQGQCFGLLGINGAGKTTTFRMLTGDLYPSKGDAFIFGSSLRNNRVNYLSQVGYCPQLDGLVEELSGFQLLRLYAQLRGIHYSQVVPTIQSWISLLGFGEVCHKPCGTYSGGNKRKLNAALALIGDPPFVFLDEPTSGVDPVSRRKLWDVLSHSQNNGQTVLITSHSMEECEAICNRLTIMVSGQMKCVGSIPDLKKVYGQGFTLKIKLRPTGDDSVNCLKEAILNTYSGCILKDEHFGLLHYVLSEPSYRWSKLFEGMEQLKTLHSIIEDYIITETTLEQVFLSFARNETNVISE